MRKLTIGIIVFIMCIQPLKVYGVVSLWKEHDAESLMALARELEQKYPDIIKVTPIGKSTDDRDVVAIVMTNNVMTMSEEDDYYTEKYHYLIEGGIHSRENVSAPMLMKIIESYAVDYYMPEYLMDVDMKDLLETTVFHFIPLSNPDGYDLSNVGIQTISEPYRSKLENMPSSNYSNYKSNVNGVDLNRNFPGLYYDVHTEDFKDIWNKKHNNYRSYVPGSAFYFGPSSASEVETQILMDYVLKYDFRNYLSFHSRGEVLYWQRWMLDHDYNQRAEALAESIAVVNGYEMIQESYRNASSGYMMDFTAMQTLKPSITIETVDSQYSLPTTTGNIARAYNVNFMVPIIAAREGSQTGYFDYKLYINNLYIRDYPSEATAQAWAGQLGGQIYIYKGRPIRQLSDSDQVLNRENLVHMIMDDVEVEDGMTLEAFEDTQDITLLQARNLGIINGYNNHFDPKGLATHQGAYVMIHNTFYSTYQSKNQYKYDISWAMEAVNVLLEKKVIHEDEIREGPILKDELAMLLARVNSPDFVVTLVE